MHTFTFTSPNGISYDMTVPDDITQQQAWCLFQRGANCIPSNHAPFSVEVSDSVKQFWAHDPIVSAKPPFDPSQPFQAIPDGFVSDHSAVSQYVWAHEPSV
jgi:hypothetical protein